MSQCPINFTTDGIREDEEESKTEIAAGYQNYEFYWECLVDANLAFNDNGQDNSVHCIFSRVYIDDVDLMEKASDKDAPQTTISALSSTINSWTELKEASEETNTDQNPAQLNVEEKQEDERVPILPEEIQEREKEEIAEAKKREEEKACWKRRKLCQNFSEKIRNLQFAPGFHIDPDPSTENSTICNDQCNIGLLKDVSFHQYDCSMNKHIKDIKRKQKKASRSSSVPPINSESKEKVETEIVEEKKDEEILEEDQQLTMEEKLKFNFGYDPKRDRRLVAKLAKKFFAKDKEMEKYWYQRYRFFSLIDNGILMDRQGWFSVTPEKIARHVADRLVRTQNYSILDAFTGVGGNTIQFSLRGAFVYAIDIDPVKLRCAARNAQIYGASRRINFICGDFFNIVRSMNGALEAKKHKGISQNPADSCPFGIDAIYLSPPWGGPSYMNSTNGEEYDIQKNMDLDGFKIFQVAKTIVPNIVYFLPKDTSINQLVALAGPGGQVESEQSMVNGKVKAIHAYYGQLVAK